MNTNIEIETFQRTKAVGNIYQRRSMENGVPRVVAYISPDEVERMLKNKEDADRRRQMELAAWTYRVSSKRPFIATQHQVAKQKMILAFEKEAGRRTTRKERQRIYVEAAVQTALKYRGKKF